MDASDVFFVARHLLAAARLAIVPQADGRLSGTERLVLEDLVMSAPTTVVEIANRTRIAQSRVSAIVADWRQRGDIEATIDLKDRRRTLVAPSDVLQSRYLGRATASAETILTHLGVAFSESERDQLLDALDLLNRRLRPAQKPRTRES